MAVLVSVVLAVACTAGYLLRPSAVESLEHRVTDAVEAGVASRTPSGRVVVVDIDEETLATVGQWPWPRYRLARLLDETARMGAAAVALDVVLAEPDQTSLARIHGSLQRELGLGPGASSPMQEIPDNDAILARTLSRGPFVLAYELLFARAKGGRAAYPPHSLQVVVHGSAGAATLASIPEAVGAVCSLPQLSGAVSQSGFLNGRADSDGRLRRLPLVLRRGDTLYPNLALASVMRATGSRVARLDTTDASQPVLTLGDNDIPMDAAGNVRIRFPAGGTTVEHVSAADVLDGRVGGDRLRGRIVFVGAQAPGISQVYDTPSRVTCSAAEVHAQLAETLLVRDYVWRPGWLAGTEIALALGIAILIGLTVGRLALGTVLLGGSLGLAGLWLGAIGLYRSQGLLASPLLPGGVLLLDGAVVLVLTYWARQRDALQGKSAALVLARASERQLASILNAIPDIVYRLDAEGRITFISPAIRRYNVEPDHFIGRPILELVAPEDRLMASRRLAERRTKRRATRNLELRLLLTDGSDPGKTGARYFSVSAEGIYPTEPPSKTSFAGTQGIVRDVELRRRLEERLAQSKRMEAIGELAAGVAHDLNNILGALVGYPELLLLDLPPDSPMRDSLESIRASSRRAAAIVQDMLTIARRGARTRDAVALNDVVSAYLASAEFRELKARHPNVQFSADLAPNLMNILGSPPHLSKLIMNVVANSAEAMPAGGLVRIATQNRYLDEEVQLYERIPEGEYVQLGVADDGVGIAKADLTRIFEPFYSKKQLGQSGSGLGMAVVWTTIKEHGGYLNVQSDEGVGTCFDFYFPVTGRELEETSRGAVLQDYLGTERILIVDDVPDQLTIAVRMLTKLGYSVSAVPGGEEAVDLLKASPFDLVVLDMVMPDGIDGLETFQRIREIRPGQKAIIASGYAESERVSAALEMGAGAYVRKPYTLEVIGLAIRKELDRK